MNKRCATCQHYGHDFSSWHMDYCTREDGPRYNELMNRDDQCEDWEERLDADGA